MTSALDVVRIAREQGRTIATAESLTAGLLAATLAEVPGCSHVLRGGVVAYATDVKEHLLGVDGALLGHVVSGEVAASMAERACAVLVADLGVGTTGVAGPDEQDGMPVGTLFVGIALADGTERVQMFRLPATRDQMRQMSVISALNFLRQCLLAT